MSELMDEKDTKYLDGRFSNLEGKMDAVVSSVEKIEGEVVDLKIQTALNEDRLKEHIKNDKTKENKSQWTWGQVITVAACLLAILADKLL